MKLRYLPIALLVCLLAVPSLVRATSYIQDATMYHQNYSIYPYSYVIEPFNSTFYQSTNASGGVSQSTNKATLTQSAIDVVTANGGGTIYLKEVMLPAVTYGSTVRVIVDYQGSHTEYRNNLQVDCPSETHGTHTHTSGTTEQTIVELTPSVVTQIHNFWIDASNLTQAFTIKVYSKIDNATYVEVRAMRLENATVADGPGFPLKEQMIDTAWKITLTSVVAEGVSRSVYYRYFTETWG
jgi:uncharacterized membrane protein